MDAEKRILLLSHDQWPSCCRFPKALNLAGFEVVTCARKGDSINLSRFIGKRFVIPGEIRNRTQLLSVIAQSCIDSKADFLIACDETSIRLLTSLYAEIKDSDQDLHQDIKRLIVSSKGNPEYYTHVFSKKLTIELAQDIGVRAPEQLVCDSAAEAAGFAREHGYPVVLKGEFGAAGYYVRVCADEQEVHKGFEAVGKAGHVIAQRHISGKPAMANAACYDGKLLACAAFIKQECYPDFKGPSAVVQQIENPEMLKTMQRFVEHTGYSGIISLDFMLDEQGRAFLIECNPRPTPVSHLGSVTGVDLFKALYCAMAGEKYKQGQSGDFEERSIALFPRELARDNESPYLYNAYHDVPWDEPELVKYFLSTDGGLASDSASNR